MNTELLRTFLEVSKTRHFGQAAENLFVTQSAVSFRVRQLEDIVGLPLFTRERNNILLTAAGDRLVAHAENILASWQLALQDVAVAEGQHLQLTIGSTSNLWDTFLQSLLPKLAQQIPGLQLHTEVSSAQNLTRGLLSGRLDLAITLDPPKVGELEAVKIGQIELLLVSTEPHLNADDIAQIGYIFVDWGTAFNLQHARLIPHRIIPILHTAQSYIALEFLLSHGGSAFLPKALITSYLQEHKLHMVADVNSVSRDVYAVYNGTTSHRLSLLPIVDLLQTLELKPTDPRDWGKNTLESQRE